MHILEWGNAENIHAKTIQVTWSSFCTCMCVGGNGTCGSECERILPHSLKHGSPLGLRIEYWYGDHTIPDRLACRNRKCFYYWSDSVLQIISSTIAEHHPLMLHSSLQQVWHTCIILSKDPGVIEYHGHQFFGREKCLTAERHGRNQWQVVEDVHTWTHNWLSPIMLK